MKTLVIISHPNISESVVNKRWMEELNKHPDIYTTHELTTTYPEKKIDVEQEHRLIEDHENLVLQFPIFWFSSPPILKQWLDEVLIHGWAYGRNGGNKLVNRKVALAVTTGIQEKDYDPSGRYHYTLAQLLAPFETTLQHYCHSNYRSFFAFYGAEKTPGIEYASSTDLIEQSTQAYLDFLSKM